MENIRLRIQVVDLATRQSTNVAVQPKGALEVPDGYAAFFGDHTESERARSTRRGQRAGKPRVWDTPATTSPWCFPHATATMA